MSDVESPIRTLDVALIDEVNRVRNLQDYLKSLRGTPRVNVDPAIFIMEHAIQKALTASTIGEASGMLSAYKHLKAFKG